MPPPATLTPPRRYGRVNWLGLWSHYRRGIHRFLDFAWESLGGPCVFTLMFLAVFVVAFGAEREVAPGVTYTSFIAPGLVMFSLCYTAFEMAGFSVLDDKNNRTIEDLLAAPLTALEVMAGYVLSAMACAMMSGALVGLVVAVFVGLPVQAPLTILGFALLGTLLFALLGTLVGLWADKWDHYSFADSFLILPLGLLSGTFFPIVSLPELGQALIAFNPVFYVIDGFRGAFIGYAETTAWQGFLLVGLLDLLLAGLVWRLFARGYKIKA